MPGLRPARTCRPRDSVLTRDERRRFAQLERTLRATDPDWLTRHHPRRHRNARLARVCAAVGALALLLLGAVTGVMLVVLAGVLLASGTATSHVSSRSRPRRHRPAAPFVHPVRSTGESAS